MQVYRFGHYEVDPAAGELRRDGVRIQLQELPVRLLCVLVERPGELITREELRHRLWPANAYLDFDHRINAAISKLRTALRDPADNGSFVATVGRRGYRFIAPVIHEERNSRDAAAGDPGTALPVRASIPMETPPDGVLVSEALPVASLPLEAATRQQPLASRRRWHAMIAVALVVALTIVGTIAFRKLMRTAQNTFDRVLVADFVNTTGQSVFDDTLRQATTVKLGESPYFSLLSAGEIRHALELLSHPAGDRLVPPLDAQVCARAGAKAVIGGSVVAAGNGFALTLTARDCRTGDQFAKQAFETASADEVLPALGHALTALRTELGETVATLKKFDTPMSEATTPSMPALAALAEGDRRRNTGAESDAMPFYKTAIELDPNFAAPYARLCAIYSNLNEPAVEREFCQGAYDRRDHVTERERLGIEADYFAGVLFDFESEVRVLELGRKVYPKDWIAANDLANECVRLGRPEEAIDAAQAALRLNSDFSFPYINLMHAFRMVNRFADAHAIADRMVARGLGDQFLFHQQLWSLAVAQEDFSAAAHEIAWVQGKGRADVLTENEAEWALAQGQVRQAASLFDRARELARTAGNADVAAGYALTQASLLADLGLEDDARQAVRTAEALHTYTGVDRFDLLPALAAAGGAGRVQQLVQQAKKDYPQATYLAAISLGDAQAVLALKRHDGEAAIRLLQAARRYDLGTPPDLATLYHRGLAHLETHEAVHAREEFEKLLAHRGVAPQSPYVSLARWGVARAWTLTGDRARARKAYEDLLAYWKGADAEFPPVRLARAEQARVSAR